MNRYLRWITDPWKHIYMYIYLYALYAYIYICIYIYMEMEIYGNSCTWAHDVRFMYVWCIAWVYHDYVYIYIYIYIYDIFVYVCLLLYIYIYIHILLLLLFLLVFICSYCFHHYNSCYCFSHFIEHLLSNLNTISFIRIISMRYR